MTGYVPSRSFLFALLNQISEYHPDLEPLRQDSDEDLLEKLFEIFKDKYEGEINFE